MGPSRRTVLRGTWLAVGLATLVTAGQTVPLLRRVSVLAPRTGDGPQGVPVNRSAVAAGVVKSARSPDYRLTVTNGPQTKTFTVADLQAMPQTTHRLPIACVEGWSADAEWTGVVLAELVAAVGASPDSDVRMISLEPPGPYSRTVLPARHARDDMTLIALKVNGRDVGPRPRIPVPADCADETRCAADEVADPHRGRGMTAVRVLLMTAGVALGGYGAVLLWDNPPVVLLRIVMWAAVGVVVHDFVFAPLCAAVGLAWRRLTPMRLAVAGRGRRAVQRRAGAAGGAGLRQARYASRQSDRAESRLPDGAVDLARHRVGVCAAVLPAAPAATSSSGSGG